MKRALLTAALCAAFGVASGQTPPPDAKTTASPEQAAKPKPALKLRLDEVEQRPRITFTPKDETKKQDSGGSLPGLGGPPSRAWERAPSEVVPKDYTQGQ
jgi:hypothetical protein